MRHIQPGNALLIIRLLGFGHDGMAGRTPLQSEIFRRRFWANYLVNCHATDLLPYQGPSENSLKLPLPWREEDFENDIPSTPAITLETGESNGSIYAELVRALTFWYVSSADVCYDNTNERVGRKFGHS